MTESGPLITTANIDDPDGFYARLIDAHRGLDAAGSRQLNARLILLLANHVGDRSVLDAALAQACAGVAAALQDPVPADRSDPHAGE